MTPEKSSLYKKNSGCVVSKREAFIDIENQAKELADKQFPNKHKEWWKNFRTVIYKEFDKVCKEWLGKSFGKEIAMFPVARFKKKASPLEAKKKLWRKDRIKKVLKIFRKMV